jgi:Bacterial type III secretion protein (HrpB1_HrpK)
MSADDYQLFHLGKTLFERLHEDYTGELLQTYVQQFEREKRTLELQLRRAPTWQAPACAALTSKEEALKAAEKIVQAVAWAFRAPGQAVAAAPEDEAASNDVLDATSASFLLNTALLGVETNYYGSARSILDALIAIKPNLAVAKLLHAHLLCRVSDAFEGRHELLQLIEEFPNFHIASAILALEDRHANMAGWRGLAESITAHASDPTSEKVANFVLRS